MGFKREDLLRLRSERQLLTESRNSVVVVNPDVSQADRQDKPRLLPPHKSDFDQSELFPDISSGDDLADVFFEGLSLQVYASRRLYKESLEHDGQTGLALTDQAGKHGGAAAALALNAAKVGFFKPRLSSPEPMEVQFRLAESPPAEPFEDDSISEEQAETEDDLD